MQARFLSRKFLLTLSTALALVASERYGEAAAVVVAYLAGESYIDSKAV